MPTASIKVFLTHGDPKRLRTSEISNWNGKAIAGPRTEFDAILNRRESENAGVYFLTGIAPETGRPAIYIGEAECVRKRIKAHVDRDFWNQIIFFISQGENLTKAHIKFLEGRLIEQARNADRAVVLNDQDSGARLPESDQADMEVFLEKINLLLPVLGVELLVPMAGASTGATPQVVLICEIKGLKARGYRTPNGFLVLKGSQAVTQERASASKFPWPIKLRQRLKDEGVLAAKNGNLEFARDAEFSSPSAAAAIIHGGHANGLTAWKDAKGTTLRELESA